MDKVILRCECGAAYNVANVEPGRRLRCKRCEAVLTVPESETEPVASVEEEAPPQRRRTQAAPTRERRTAARAERSAGRRERAARPEAPAGKSKMGLWIGIGVALVIVVVGIFAFGSGPSVDPQEKERQEREAARDAARETFQSLLQKARGSRQGADFQVAMDHVRAHREGEFEDAMLKPLYDAWIGADPQAETPNRALGNQFVAEVERWLTPDQFQAWESFQGKAKAAETQKTVESVQAALVALDGQRGLEIPEVRRAGLCELWVQLDPEAEEPRKVLGHHFNEQLDAWQTPGEYTVWQKEQELLKDPFHKAAREIIATALTDKVGKEETLFDYYYDCPEVPRPYLVAVSQGFKSTDILAKKAGRALSTLNDAFLAQYGEELGLKPIAKPVPVLMFQSEKEFEKYRVDERTDLPSSSFVGGFYTSGVGLLTIWESSTGKDMSGTYFHEGTHQLLDFYSSGLGRNGKTPWFQEGIAEYFGSVERVQEGSKLVYKMGQVNDDRMNGASLWAQAGTGKRTSLKTLVSIDYPTFFAARQRTFSSQGSREDRLLVMECYHLSWAMIKYCFDDPDYHDGITAYLKREIANDGGLKSFEECLGIESDDDWEFFEELLDSYIINTLRPEWTGGR